MPEPGTHLPETEPRAAAPANARLRAERLIRAAARGGNQLLAGARVEVRVADAEVRAVLGQALTRMGARAGGAAGGSAPDLVIDDAGAAPRGSDAAARIAWAAQHMAATRALAAQLRETGALAGVRVAVSLVLEPKTAVLALALRDTGAEVAVFAPVGETDPAVAAALAGLGVRVFAPAHPIAPGAADGAATEIDRAHAAEVLAWGPHLLIDDGAHLIRLAHTEHPEALATMRAASEETTSGVRPLREMAAEGALRIPVVAVNDARTKTDFDNLIGTGQSCVFAIADALDDPAIAPLGVASGLHGQHWVVIGYGPVGVGVARFAAALGARITVVERDAVRALAAVHDGHEAGAAVDALPDADVVVSATGVWRTLSAAALASLRPGAAVAVAGGIDGELALDDLADLGWVQTPVTAQVSEWIPPRASPGARGLLVIAAGAGVNYTAAEGNPIEVMDLSFATQLASLAWLLAHEPAPGVHALPASAEQQVARLALAARGGSADPPVQTERAGGAAQPWRVHRYRGAESATP